MRRADQLVTVIRRQSENEQIDPDDGISTDEVIQFMNDGQERLESAIVRLHEKAFVKDDFIDLVQNQEIYTLPFGTFINHSLVSVEYSFTGRAEDYIPLRRGKHIERVSFRGFPSFYIPRVREVIVNPISDRSVVAGLRIAFNAKHPRMDLRRGVITSITNTAGVLTDFIVDASSGVVSYDASDFDEFDRISVCDVDGVQTANNIPLAAANSDGTLTVRSGFVLPVATQSIAVGDYVTLGENSGTHLQMPQICEKYLIEYATWKMLMRDSSTDSQEHAAVVSALEADIVASFAEISSDIDRIPIINADYIW
jgi:hypothetical protein